MSNFPLYDSLSAESENIDLTTKQKDELIKLIKNFNDDDEEGNERIYVLIRMFQLENSEDKSTFKIPYGGKYVKNDLKFDLNDLPFKLKQMIYKFVKIHTKTIKEEKTPETQGEISNMEVKKSSVENFSTQKIEFLSLKIKNYNIN